MEQAVVKMFGRFFPAKARGNDSWVIGSWRPAGFDPMAEAKLRIDRIRFLSSMDKRVGFLRFPG